MKKFLLPLILLLSYYGSSAQEVSLLSQFNGHYDYTALGNTLNLHENESGPCEILTESSADLNLDSNQQVIAAYLYWAGSGEGDFEVKLNGEDISAERTFSYSLTGSREFFAAYTDVTDQIIAEGNGTYTVSDLDLTEVIPGIYCNSGTNFGGWSIIVVYEDSTLPLNQVSIFDGLEGVDINHNELIINLENINVVDNIGAKIGFLAWEGDASLAVDETLQVNGNIISNPPLNPADNAFNSTNSFTGSNELYNMDLDYYDVENNISVGDTSAEIKLTSGDGHTESDFVMVNNIVTVFNSQLPDPSPEIDAITNTCQSRIITVDFTIHNDNSTDVLPAGNPIYFYADGQLIDTGQTLNEIPINGEESQQVNLTIPNTIPDNFTLQIFVNSDADGNIAVAEINEDNDSTEETVILLFPEIANPLQDLKFCDDVSNDGTAFFDFTENASLARGNQTDVSVKFYLTEQNAEDDMDEIQNPTNFENTEIPQLIYARVTSNQDPDCYAIESFLLDLYYMPTANSVDGITICDDFSNDGKALFDLTQMGSEIIDGQPNTEIHYFLNEDDAVANQNIVENPDEFENTANPQQVFVRIENTDHPECFDVTSFPLNVNSIATTPLSGLKNCNTGFYKAIFDLTTIGDTLDLNSNQNVEGYYTSAADASNFSNPIANASAYENLDDPQQIFIRVEDETGETCYQLYSFSLTTKNCPPFIPNGFSPNDDGINDTFFISGLYDIFVHFHLKVFSRYGNLIYEGNNSTEPWDGISNRALFGWNKECPTGTYFYILDLHDPDYGLYKGWVYLNR